ncbi:MAG: tRNA wybutosine-synthesizing 3 family protein [bacterium]
MVDSFNQRKTAVLSKLDKSSIGKWDKKIVKLCDKLNKSKNYYTTSSCSGRIVLMLDQDKKENGLFLVMSHDLISFEWLEKNLDFLSKEKKLIKFKCEPPILHVVCKDLKIASELLEKARKIGWRRSGIYSFGKNIVVELNSTDKLEFPIINNGKSLVDKNFLKIIVKISNEKLKRGWEKIENLKKSL